MSCLTCVSSVAPFISLACATVVSVNIIILLAAPVSLRVSTPPSLLLPPDPLPPSTPFLGLLCLSALPRAPPPLAPAANIARKDEDVDNWTDRGQAHWSVADRSALRRKFPSRPLAVVGDGISWPLFLHRPQQYHPVHCRSALRHLLALADGQVV